MHHLLIIACICLFAAELNCQGMKTDTSNTRDNKINNNYPFDADTNTNNFSMMPEEFSHENNLINPGDLFLLTRHFSLSEASNLYYEELSLSPLSLSTQDQNTFPGNKKEFSNYFQNIYLQSKLTTLQQILGSVDFSAALLLGGYRIWKDYIKKK
jgi:hypothetical protein